MSTPSTSSHARCTFTEFEVALAVAEVIEERILGDQLLKAVLLTVGWIGPLHILVVVDEVRDEERILTMYEPDPNRWCADYLGRR